MRPLIAHCHLGLGKLYWRTDKREHAREHLTAATMMYGEMEMRSWLDQAESATTELARDTRSPWRPSTMRFELSTVPTAL